MRILTLALALATLVTATAFSQKKKPACPNGDSFKCCFVDTDNPCGVWRGEVLYQAALHGSVIR